MSTGPTGLSGSGLGSWSLGFDSGSKTLRLTEGSLGFDDNDDDVIEVNKDVEVSLHSATSRDFFVFEVSGSSPGPEKFFLELAPDFFSERYLSTNEEDLFKVFSLV